MAQGDAPGYRDLGRTLLARSSRAKASTASRPAHRDDRETSLNHGAGQAHHKRRLKGGDKIARIFSGGWSFLTQKLGKEQ